MVEIPGEGEAVENITGVEDRVIELSEQLKQLTANLQASTGNFSASTQAFSGISSNVIGNMAESMELVTGGSKAAADSISGVNRALGAADPRQMNAVSTNIQKITGMSEQSGSAINRLFRGVGANFEELKTVASSTAALVALGGIKKGLDMINKTGLMTIQQDLMDFEKTALSASQRFGQSFEQSQGSINMFHQELANTMDTTKSTRDEVMKVGAALSVAFDAEQQVGQLDNLSKAQADVRSSMTLTNTAILVGAAKGMQAEKVAGMMTEAYMNLGESQADVAKIFGEIGIAAEKSGLSFEKASDAIMASADSLKMWGGTIGSVTPLYKAFTGALGEGQKGLAVDLMNNFTRGLQQMGLETRALIGLQAGMGGGGGALGVGLEMEALMEQGEEGMAQMTENLLTTIKGFTGGAVLTREEARETGREQEFVMQRQLLKQMGIVADDASGTKMLGILKEIDAHGLQTGSDAEKALGEMMQTGEKTQEATTGDLKKATLDVERAVHTQGRNIVGALKSVMQRTGAERVTRAVGGTATAMASGELGFGTDMLRDFGTRIGGDTEENINKFSDKVERMFGIKTETDEEARMVRTEKLLEKLSAKIESERTEKGTGFVPTEGARERLDVQGTLPMNTVRPMIQEMSNKIGEEIQKLKHDRSVNQLMGGSGLDKSELAKLTVLQQRQRQVRRMMRQRGPFRVRSADRPPIPETMPRDEPVDPTPQRFPNKLAELEYRNDANIARTEIDRGVAQAGVARDAIQVMATAPIPTAPVREAQEITEEVQKQKEVSLKITTEPIEQEVKFSLWSDQSTVTVEVDEQEVKQILRAEITGQE
jgi:hypothetical protein